MRVCKIDVSCCEHSSAFIFDRIFFILAGNQNIYNISEEFEIGPRTAELAALGHLEKSPWTCNGKNLVDTLAPSFLIQSSSLLQVTRTCKKA